MDNSEDPTFDIPFLGKVSQTQAEKFLPFYVRLRKDPEFRAIIPKEYDQKIMAYAEIKGLAKPKRKSLEDIDIPLSEIHEAIDYLSDEGYSVTQIAKQLNIYPTIVTHRCIDREEDQRKQQETEEKTRENEEAPKSRYIPLAKAKAWLKRRL